MGPSMLRSVKAACRMQHIVARRISSTAPAKGGFYGLDPVKVDQNIEKWAAHREDIEETFEWHNKNIVRLAVFAFAVPAWMYYMTKKEMVDEDKAWDKAATSRGTKREYL